MPGTMRNMTYESIVDMPNIPPLAIPVFDLQSCDWLAPYRRKTRVVCNNHHVRYGQDR